MSSNQKDNWILHLRSNKLSLRNSFAVTFCNKINRFNKLKKIIKFKFKAN